MKQSRLSALCAAVVCSLSLLLLVACGDPAGESDTQVTQQPTSPPVTDEEQPLRVKALAIGDETVFAAIETSLQQMEGVDSIEFSRVSVDRDSGDLLSHLQNTDLVLFPSDIQKVFRMNKDSFYPTGGDEAESALPMGLASIYSLEEETRWAVPLLVDPMVMVMKADTGQPIGEPMPIREWFKLDLIRQSMMSGNYTGPLMVFTDGSPRAVSDAAALLALGFGWQADRLRSDYDELTLPAESIPLVLEREFSSLKRFLTPFDAPDEALESLPGVASLQEFVESPAKITFARYSDWQNLDENLKKQTLATPALGPQGGSVLASVLVAAIPAGSSAPDAAGEVISQLVARSETLAQSGNRLPASQLNRIEGFSMDGHTVVVVREDSLALSPDQLVGIINGLLSVDELTGEMAVKLPLPEENKPE